MQEIHDNVNSLEEYLATIHLYWQHQGHLDPPHCHLYTETIKSQSFMSS